MARKTKEDAELTRERIIDAAREAFLAHGVSRTTMEHIAAQAGLTRGAVYWHFDNKTDLFKAMRERVLLPLIDRIDDASLTEGSQDPITRIENFLSGTIQNLNDSVEMREIYEIMMMKCEYVEEFEPVLRQILCTCSGVTEKICVSYEHAKLNGQLNQALDPEELANDTNLFFSGLLHMWVKDRDGTNFRHKVPDLIKAHIKLRRKQP